uniref:Uncharacterized protein n=1 Tax=Romanomermis culicivorax TaxID=13658 RepID=A0A915K4C1_ROMCU
MTFFLWAVAISRNLRVLDFVDRKDLASIAGAAREWTRGTATIPEIAHLFPPSYEDRKSTKNPGKVFSVHLMPLEDNVQADRGYTRF